MECLKCRGDLEVLRLCSRVRMRCTNCGKEYHIHEVADQLDSHTEKILEKYNVIIYD